MRNCFGVIWRSFLKRAMKWLVVEKPRADEISVMLASVEIRRRSASRIFSAVT